MFRIKDYDSFNGRRYGNPWVAIVNPNTAKVDFTNKVGAYTGSYGKGEAGTLYMFDAPSEGQVIAYGQKDNRGNGTTMVYAQMRDGALVEISKTDLVDALMRV